MDLAHLLQPCLALLEFRCQLCLLRLKAADHLTGSIVLVESLGELLTGVLECLLELVDLKHGGVPLLLEELQHAWERH